MDTVGKPTVISTFAGTGGSSLGYHWAGFRELLAIDFDDHAVECFKLNFPDVPVWKRSVTEVTGQEILDFCKIKWGELDVFDGSPPCQGFSTAGKREVRDPRNDLFMHYCRLIDELGPKVFVMENVTGMAKGKMRGRFIEIMQTLKGMNYNVKCKQMNSMYYGVPQSRERLIFVGVRKDLGKQPTFPVPSNKITTVLKALNGIQPTNFAAYKKDSWAWKAWHNTKIGRNLSASTNSNSGFNHNKVDPRKPLPTMCKSPCHTKTGLMHWNEPRSMALNELKVLCSFPENWKLGDDLELGWNRLGNAVMPKFMQAIATTIKKEILEAANV